MNARPIKRTLRRFLNWSKAEQETQGFESNSWMCFRPGLCAGAMKKRLPTRNTLGRIQRYGGLSIRHAIVCELEADIRSERQAEESP